MGATMELSKIVILKRKFPKLFHYLSFTDASIEI